MNRSEVVRFRTALWVPLFLSSFVLISACGIWISLPTLVSGSSETTPFVVLCSSLLFLGIILWMAILTPRTVSFHLGDGTINASYFARGARRFSMAEVQGIEWRANMYAQQPALLLRFVDGRSLLIPPATHDSRINPIVAELRRGMTP